MDQIIKMGRNFTMVLPKDRRPPYFKVDVTINHRRIRRFAGYTHKQARETLKELHRLSEQNKLEKIFCKKGEEEMKKSQRIKKCVGIVVDVLVQRSSEMIPIADLYRRLWEKAVDVKMDYVCASSTLGKRLRELAATKKGIKGGIIVHKNGQYGHVIYPHPFDIKRSEGNDRKELTQKEFTDEFNKSLASIKQALATKEVRSGLLTMQTKMRGLNMELGLTHQTVHEARKTFQETIQVADELNKEMTKLIDIVSEKIRLRSNTNQKIHLS